MDNSPKSQNVSVEGLSRAETGTERGGPRGQNRHAMKGFSMRSLQVNYAQELKDASFLLTVEVFFAYTVGAP